MLPQYWGTWNLHLESFTISAFVPFWPIHQHNRMRQFKCHTHLHPKWGYNSLLCIHLHLLLNCDDKWIYTLPFGIQVAEGSTPYPIPFWTVFADKYAYHLWWWQWWWLVEIYSVSISVSFSIVITDKYTHHFGDGTGWGGLLHIHLLLICVNTEIYTWPLGWWWLWDLLFPSKLCFEKNICITFGGSGDGGVL